MLRTFTLFTFKGIDLKISWSFQVFLTLIFVMGFIAGLSKGVPVALASGCTILFMLVFAYGFVTIHEYGHALAAKHLGYKTRDIALYPMAGLASISGDWHKNPWHEFIITVFGPLTNVVMGGVAFIVLQFCPPETLQHALVNFAFKVNFTLLIFNLIPVYPMDGGRIFRSIVGGITNDWWLGTIWATRVSFICGLIAVPLGFYFDYAIAGLMIGFMGLLASQAELSHLKNIREIEQIEEERLLLFEMLLRGESEKLWSNDKEKQNEFISTMLGFHKFLMRFVNWAVKEKIPVEKFERAIAHLFSTIYNDEEQRLALNKKATYDEVAVFEEICEASDEDQSVDGDPQPLEAQRESA